MTKADKQSSVSKASTLARCATASSGSSATPRRESRDNRFPAALRVKSRDDFQAVFEHGRVAADAVLVIHAIRAKNEVTRLGLSVSKKVGCAPVRNRWKRLIREAFRNSHRNLPAGLTLVVRPRRGAAADYRLVESSLKKLVRKLDRQV